MEKEGKEESARRSDDQVQEFDPCMDAQADGAPCNCSDSDCRTCGKGVPVKK